MISPPPRHDLTSDTSRSTVKLNSRLANSNRLQLKPAGLPLLDLHSSIVSDKKKPKLREATAPKVPQTDVILRDSNPHRERREQTWDFLVYPDQGADRATVYFEDLHRLREGVFLNDNIIDFYSHYLRQSHKENHGTVG